MPRDSISRRVARAAATGGSKSYRSRTPYGWYAILLLVCLLGVALIAFSRHERQQRVAAASTTTTSTTAPPKVPPTVTDHWQVAMEVDVCGRTQFLPRSAVQPNGMTTNGDGVVNIQPVLAGRNAAQFEGNNATVGKFLSLESVVLSDNALKLPASMGKLAGMYVNGHKCGGKAGVAGASIWSTPTTAAASAVSKNVAALPFANGEMFMITFVPKGAKVPAPASQATVQRFLLANPSGSVTTTTTTLPSGSTTSTTPSGSSTTTSTTAAGSSTTTSTSSTTTSAPSGGSTTTTTAG